MSTKVEATIEDLYKVEGKAELVNGEIILMSPTGFLPGYAAGEIFSSLREYSKREGIASAETFGSLADKLRDALKPREK